MSIAFGARTAFPVSPDAPGRLVSLTGRSRLPSLTTPLFRAVRRGASLPERRDGDLPISRIRKAALSDSRVEAQRSAPAAADVKQRAEAKIADIETKIRSLQKMKKALAKLTSACSCHGTSAECPLLHALDGEERASDEGRT